MKFNIFCATTLILNIIGFMLIGTLDERSFHLQALAAIAQIVHHPEFEWLWLNARDEDQLRDILLLSNRRRVE